MAKGLTVLFFVIIGMATIATIGAGYYGFKMLYYIDPWWQYSPGESESINSWTKFFVYASILCAIAIAVLWFFGSPSKAGTVPLICRIVMGILLIVIFVGTTVLHSKVTVQGIINAQKNYSDGRKDIWTQTQKDELDAWYNKFTTGMTTDARKAWIDNFEDNERDVFIRRFPQRLTVVYFFQMFSIAAIIIYYSHFLLFEVK